jgi:hypothetical protein
MQINYLLNDGISSQYNQSLSRILNESIGVSIQRLENPCVAQRESTTRKLKNHVNAKNGDHQYQLTSVSERFRRFQVHH